MTEKRRLEFRAVVEEVIGRPGEVVLVVVVFGRVGAENVVDDVETPIALQSQKFLSGSVGVVVDVKADASVDVVDVERRVDENVVCRRRRVCFDHQHLWLRREDDVDLADRNVDDDSEKIKINVF